ncbi:MULTISPECIES: 2-oxo acid dehydrogenase subunit E2 [unclassified Apibacter]|uniref:2-oxo acid dehydrogenase subunit E2 n=1 Tax=unclassified Apibacter TaxID=2630820 RepID=UPI001321FF70|nr:MULTISPECIES: 2-oxo acid dehydrogenase subunit E2 [unclassified Apibacter]MCX8676913.1 2-oxo acid dehydrogenase subunit E2 [Apibacter sp. B3919]MXO24705.1 biotin/lipoyl-binding protein [Apibacter sp. B3924]MXO25949.1 biotin/lipoyl-binding protein [Apibacter sp. B3813]MXO27900.1 biotin/lipoyl-binding protein [Apibacter sp. B3913]MXO29740.1 biotin/lipoyl-binding protein [Apibacter sp. B3912]
MAEVIKMPRLSDTMTEGKVSKWNLKVGDPVKEGDILAEIETDKAVQDFDYDGDDGILLYQGVKEGDAAPVDSLLAIIGKAGEDISALIGGANSNSSSSEPTTNNDSSNTNTTSTPSASVEIPKDVEIIKVPRLSDTMTEGKVSKWNVKVGDTIKEGDVIAEIETDKAVQDFEYDGNGGVLLYQGVKEGDSAPIESLLAIVGPAGTDVSGIIAGGTAASTATSKPAASEPTAVASNDSKPSSEANTVSSGNGKIFASPLAKKIAKEKGISLDQIKGSGDNGRIIRKDVENFVPTASTTSASSSSAKSAPVAPQITPGVDTETPNSSMRNAIAKSLSHSLFTAPHYNLVFEINMDNAMEARKAINSLPDTKVSFNDIVIKAVAIALRKHPQINSTWSDTKIIHRGNINVGVAVAVEDGLVVPVIKNTDYLSLTQISSAVKDLAGRARDKKLKANEMDGSTFTISNLGMFGVESFNSIINQPNSCILSVGAIIQKPVVKNGQIVVGNTMQISLACDHRVVDGATGAQFLQTLKMYLENPVSLLA